MKKFFLFLFRLLCWLCALVYIACSLSSWLSPEKYFFTDAFALFFPFAFLIIVILLLIALFTYKKTALFLFIILFAGFKNIKNSFGFHPFTDKEVIKDSNSLSVLTWNVFYFQNDHDAKNYNDNSPGKKMIDAIINSDADILCFQEYVSYNNINGLISVDSILKNRGYKYILIDSSRSYQVNGGYVNNGTVLFSKLPVLNSNIIKMPNSNNECLIYADIQLNNKPVRIFTTHLTSLGLYADTANTELAKENIYRVSYKRKGSIARKIKRTSLLHEKEAKIISSAIKQSPYPVVFCADLNSVPASYNYNLVRGDLQDAFLKKGFGMGQTYDALSPTLRIDVCFASNQLTVKQCRVNKLHDLSDHFPVITTLKYGEK